MTETRALQSHEAAPAATQSAVEALARALCEASGLDWDAQSSAMTNGSGADDEQPYYRHLAQTAIDFISALSAPAGAEWRTIDSAPKDGTAILVSIGPDDQVVVFYHAPKADAPSHCWQQANGIAYHKDAPTHWMPLPAAPKPEGE